MLSTPIELATLRSGRSTSPVWAGSSVPSDDDDIKARGEDDEDADERAHMLAGRDSEEDALRADLDRIKVGEEEDADEIMMLIKKVSFCHCVDEPHSSWTLTREADRADHR